MWAAKAMKGGGKGNPSDGKGGPTGKGLNGCCNCGNPGHIAANCGAPKKESRTCDQCGKVGHLAREIAELQYERWRSLVEEMRRRWGGP